MSWRPIVVSDKELAAAIPNNRKKARFLVDESLGMETTNVLRSLGWNAQDVSEVGLSGRSDEDVLAYAFRDGRILLTHDTDFLDDRRFPPHRNPGAVVLPGGSGEQEPLIHALSDLLVIVGPFGEHYQGAKMQFSADRIFSVRHMHGDGAMRTDRYRIGGRGPALELVDDSPKINSTTKKKAKHKRRG